MVVTVFLHLPITASTYHCIHPSLHLPHHCIHLSLHPPYHCIHPSLHPHHHCIHSITASTCHCIHPSLYPQHHCIHLSLYPHITVSTPSLLTWTTPAFTSSLIQSVMLEAHITSVKVMLSASRSNRMLLRTQQGAFYCLPDKVQLHCQCT